MGAARSASIAASLHVSTALSASPASDRTVRILSFIPEPFIKTAIKGRLRIIESITQWKEFVTTTSEYRMQESHS